MWQARTIIAAVSLLLTTAVGAPAVLAEEKDPELTPFPLVFRSDDRPDVVSVVVLDARTGRPIEGAVVRGYVEGTDERAATVNALACALRADAMGLATTRVDAEALKCSHWTVTAKGYRPYADYHGYWPPQRVELEPATPMAVRLLDAWGQPAADAEVETFTGCPHAPAVVRGRTDAQGIFRVEDGAPEGFSVWVRAAGCEHTDENIGAVFADAPDTVLLMPGITVRGRIRDADGAPVYGAVVRGAGFPRGPATQTDTEGRFTLPGLGREAVKVFHPLLEVETEKSHLVARVAEDVPLELTWSVHGWVRPEGRGRLVVRARTPDGGVATGLALLVVGADGVGYETVTNAAGDSTLDLAPGEYRVRGDDPFAAFEVPEARALVAVDGTTTTDMAVAARPRLHLEGEVPTDLGASLVVAASVHYLGQSEEESGPPKPIWLPADAPALLRLSNDYGTFTTFVPVGPAVAGVRTVTISLPPPHRVRLSNSDALDGAWCWLSPWEVPGLRRPLELRQGVATLWHGGRFLLRIEGEDEEPDRVVALDLPLLASGGVERVIDPDKDALPVDPEGAARLVVTMADGSAIPEMTVSGDGHRTSGAESPIEMWAPNSMLLAPSGLQPMRVHVSRPGEHKVLFPTGGIDLRAVDGSGAPVPASILIDGVTHEAEAGALTLRGLAAGTHAIVVQRTSWPPRVPEAVLWRFTLADGELRAKTITVP